MSDQKDRFEALTDEQWVTSRCVVEFLDTVRVSWFDYAAVISGMATSLGVWSSRRMEFSEK